MSLWSSIGNQADEHLRDPSVPVLTREACLSQKGIRSFLKLSRLASDDTLKQHLNNILDSRNDLRINNINRSNSEICDSFIKEYLFPHWKTRLQTIEYCNTEANSLKLEIDKVAITNEKKDIDPRIDPYYERSNSDENAEQYYKYTQLSTWVRNERDIESIVQDRSIEVLMDRCGIDKDLKNEFNRFQGK